MWLSGQQKRPADSGEGQTGRVTIGGPRPAVQLDSERRGLAIFSPAGFRWTPRVGQRVLVIKCQDEDPCIVGAEQTQEGAEAVEIEAKRIDLQGQVFINGVPLEEYVARLMGALGG